MRHFTTELNVQGPRIEHYPKTVAWGRRTMGSGRFPIEQMRLPLGRQSAEIKAAIGLYSDGRKAAAGVFRQQAGTEDLLP